MREKSFERAFRAYHSVVDIESACRLSLSIGEEREERGEGRVGRKEEGERRERSWGCGGRGERGEGEEEGGKRGEGERRERGGNPNPTLLLQGVCNPLRPP